MGRVQYAGPELSWVWVWMSDSCSVPKGIETELLSNFIYRLYIFTYYIINYIIYYIVYISLFIFHYFIYKYNYIIFIIFLYYIYYIILLFTELLSTTAFSGLFESHRGSHIPLKAKVREGFAASWNVQRRGHHLWKMKFKAWTSSPSFEKLMSLQSSPSIPPSAALSGGYFLTCQPLHGMEISLSGIISRKNIISHTSTLQISNCGRTPRVECRVRDKIIWGDLNQILLLKLTVLLSIAF